MLLLKFVQHFFFSNMPAAEFYLVLPSIGQPGTEFPKEEFHPRFPMVKSWRIANLWIRTPKKFANWHNLKIFGFVIAEWDQEFADLRFADFKIKFACSPLSIRKKVEKGKTNLYFKGSGTWECNYTLPGRNGSRSMYTKTACSNSKKINMRRSRPETVSISETEHP